MLLFINREEGRTASNAALVEDLVHSGALRRPDCVAAFQAIDRKRFWIAESGQLAYADMPLRSGRLHLSAPHIYGKALESLMPLRPGMSFLNVGSGTGYFNSIVSELIGDSGTNHGIDMWPETIAHARSRCAQYGKGHIEFTLGNVYQLDVAGTMRYDRIYLGACANPRSKYLYRLLEVGGILIGPFQVGPSQQLRRVVRLSEAEFGVEVLGSVQFASLVEPGPIFAPRPRGPQREISSEGRSLDGVGLPGVPFTFALAEKAWSPERSWLYPEPFRRVVAAVGFSRQRDLGTVCLPAEIWVKHIFPWCPRWWFPRSEPRAPLALTPPRLSQKDRASEGCDGERSDDEASTRAPSTSTSAHTTPEAGPSRSPLDIEAMDVDESEDRSGQGASPPPGRLVEVFGDGQRHVIGTDEDPDEMRPDEGRRLVVPLRVLQMLAEDMQRRRRTRRELEEDDSGPEALDEDEDEVEDDDDEESRMQVEPEDEELR